MTQITGMQSLERRLSEMFFGTPRTPRPCKRYRVPNYDRGTNRYFRTQDEAIAHAAKQAQVQGEEVEVLVRASGRGRCPNVWMGQADHVQPDGTIKVYWGGKVLSHHHIDGTRVEEES